MPHTPRALGFFACALLAVLIAAPAALAEVPLRTLLDSSAGRYLFEEAPRGVEIVGRLLGAEVASTERVPALARTLGRRELGQVSTEIERGLERIRGRFEAEFGSEAQSLFSGRGRLLTSRESAFLARAMEEELGAEFLARLPGRPAFEVHPTFATAREDFLAGAEGAAAAAPRSSRTVLEAWAVGGIIGRPGPEAAVNAFGRFEALRAANPSIEAVLPRSTVYDLLADEEMAVFATRLDAVLAAVQADTRAVSAETKLRRALVQLLGRDLATMVPASQIRARVAGLRTGSSGDIRRALGELSFSDARLLLHGRNPLSPSSTSLIGRYIQETGAATVTRTFPMGPGLGNGPERLVVAIDRHTLQTWLKYFGNENLLGHLHTPGQGTLYLTFNGKVGSYAQITEAFRSPTNGTIIPTIVLSTTEGQRAAQYFRLGSADQASALTPWNMPGYCATGGYNSCTHWVGNIPIGDRMVWEYKFPGYVDQYASNRVPPTADPRVQVLAPYANPNPLHHRVWKVPGNEQLADVLGLQAANLRGELANPGWVAHTLTGSAGVDRVPVVFLVVPDARAPIAPDFALQINAY